MNSGRFGIGGTGHAGQLVIHPEIVLEGDRGKGLVFPLDLDLFLGLQGLVQPIAVASSLHGAAGEFIDDDDLAFLDDIVDVPFEQHMGLQSLAEVMKLLDIAGIIEILDFEQILAQGDALLGEGYLPGFLVDQYNVLRP